MNGLNATHLLVVLGDFAAHLPKGQRDDRDVDHADALDLCDEVEDRGGGRQAEQDLRAGLLNLVDGLVG